VVLVARPASIDTALAALGMFGGLLFSREPVGTAVTAEIKRAIAESFILMFSGEAASDMELGTVDERLRKSSTGSYVRSLYLLFPPLMTDSNEW